MQAGDGAARDNGRLGKIREGQRDSKEELGGLRGPGGSRTLFPSQPGVLRHGEGDTAEKYGRRRNKGEWEHQKEIKKQDQR